MTKTVKKTENKGNYYLSEVLLGENVVLETVYDQTRKETSFAQGTSYGSTVVKDYTDVRKVQYLPYPADDHLLVKGFIKLPSELVKGVEINELFKEVKEFISKYVKLPDEFLAVSAVYVLLSWVYDRFHTLPYLRVIGDFGTGKSRFLQVVGNICYKPIPASSITTAGVFRTINLIKGTLIWDEANFKNSDMWSEITKVLNSGHSKGSPVLRMKADKDNGSYTTEAFEVFGPKILGSREEFGDKALESRCLSHTLLPGKNDKPVHLPTDFEEVSTELRNKLLAFRLEYFFKVATDEATLGGLDFPRLKQSALALTSLASYIGKEVSDTVLSYLKKYEIDIKNNQKVDIKVDILLCILNMVEDEIKRAGVTEKKIYMQQIKLKFEESNDDYSRTDHKEYKDRDNQIWVYPVNTLSARKIGANVRSLGIRTLKDGEGFYIPLAVEMKTIEVLAERYGLELPWLSKKQKKIELEDKISEEELGSLF